MVSNEEFGVFCAYDTETHANLKVLPVGVAHLVGDGGTLSMP